MQRYDFKNITPIQIDTVKAIIKDGTCYCICRKGKCPFSYEHNNRVNFNNKDLDQITATELSQYRSVCNCPTAYGTAVISRASIDKPKLLKGCYEFLDIFDVNKIDLTEE